jgi:hypothetical protein
LGFHFLQFLEYPPFVISWFVFGILAAVWLIVDEYKVNTYVQAVLKTAWPVILFFFSAIGLILYILSCRPPGIGKMHGKKAEAYHHLYTSYQWKRVTGSVMHCIAGDGLGILSAMIMARFLRFDFWPEFWLEYTAGFIFGWLIFQYLAQRKMGHGIGESLWRAFRAEFFSMMTVMLGMGLVMYFVTPSVTGTRPLPDTYAFWGFVSLGLFVGMLFTYPMNWWLVRIGWKHGMA